jgi:hypothetical protein
MTGSAGLILLDERSLPSLRERIGELLAGADEAAFAVARIRLAVLDLTDREIGRVRRCRVLLGHLDASTLLDAAEGSGPGGSAAAMAGLVRFARSGRLEVRSVGLGGWTPDFAVVSGRAGRTGVLGSIQFGNPELVIGPAFTAITANPAMAGFLLSRFDDLWERAHDVLPAILEVLERAHGVGVATAGERGDADPA